jgi:hypothetical protein
MHHMLFPLQTCYPMTFFSISLDAYSMIGQARGKESVARQTELGQYLKNPSRESHLGE